MEKFLELLNEQYRLENEQIKILLNAFEKVDIQKSEFLLLAGNVARKVYLVDKGVIRVFSDDGNQESTRRIAFENEFATSFDSFINQTPSSESIQALEEGILYELSYINVRKLNETVPAWRAFYINRIEQAFTLHYGRIEAFQSMTAKERYDALISQRPQMIARLSNKVLASYLGITQESLSRIKSKV
ncbi:Crp/Fnr family transcriptional regulator [Flagellimonas oceanensis]|uniref:Crp/Fnr family transcriptional regulator n=1 Tax=Flagellimonas oceanensis TaxID=2499163 RepID=UPI000F8D9E2C|nr:Crp/Fnr family transcriptional regulator [Allomuricauda oceanensis]